MFIAAPVVCGVLFLVLVLLKSQISLPKKSAVCNCDTHLLFVLTGTNE